jgi:hypothetical protein
MTEPAREPEPADPRDVPGEADGIVEGHTDPEQRLDDVEAEFGPDAPPRGATPGNPEAEENPS